jgi:hypothetical protein
MNHGSDRCLLAAKADGAENVLRVKAATQGFRKESNLSVITEDGSYYTFNVKYASEPVKLSVEMADFLHAGYEINKPGNELPVFLSDLGSESPYMVRLIMETIHKNNRTKLKHIGNRNFGVQILIFHAFELQIRMDGAIILRLRKRTGFWLYLASLIFFSLSSDGYIFGMIGLFCGGILFGCLQLRKQGQSFWRLMEPERRDAQA